MLKGEYSHNIDAKGRLIIPAKFRDDLGENFVIKKEWKTAFMYTRKQNGTLSKKNLTPYQPLQTRMPVLLRISFREAQQTETLINKAEH